jgi:hypothetical protein
MITRSSKSQKQAKLDETASDRDAGPPEDEIDVEAGPCHICHFTVHKRAPTRRIIWLRPGKELGYSSKKSNIFEREMRH